MQISINFNDEVRFELTEHGADVYEDHRRNRGLEPDGEPRTSMPLWRFMQIFGPRIRGNGGQPLTVGNKITAGDTWAALDQFVVEVFDEPIQDRHRYDSARDGTPSQYLRECGRELARLREDKAEAARKRDLLADAIADALGEDWRGRSPVEAVRELARRAEKAPVLEPGKVDEVLGFGWVGKPASQIMDELVRRADSWDNYVMIRTLLEREFGGPVDGPDDVEIALGEARAALQGRTQPEGSSLGDAAPGTLGALCLAMGPRPVPESYESSIAGEPARRSAIGKIFERMSVGETIRRGGPTPSERALSDFARKYAGVHLGAEHAGRDIKPEIEPIVSVRSRLPFKGPVDAVLHVVTACIADLDHDAASRWLDLFERMQKLDLDLDTEDTEA